MVLKITHKVCGMPFTAVADNIAQAYEYIQAIIKAESLNFPNQQESLSEYMAELARFKDGNLLKTENHIFKIEADRSDERIQSLTDALRDADETIGKMYGAGGAYCDGLIEGYQERTKARAATWSNG